MQSILKSQAHLHLTNPLISITLVPKMLPRPARILRAVPSTAQVAQRGKSTSTSASARIIQDRGMTLDARARVQQHVRKLQSSAITGASPAVRPSPAQHFQPPPSSLPSTAPGSDNPLDASSSKVKDGLDYS